MAPNGWRSTKLGRVFKSRREKGYGGLPTLSVTLNDGMVLRESLERKSETNLSPEEHLLVRKGDIAYNMMRMWQGASGLAPFDALVSPAYVVLTPTNEIDSVFASYLLKSVRMIYLLWAYSYGLTSDRLRLYFADFSLVPAILPPVAEQRRIAKILRVCDRAIETTEKLLENAEDQHRGLMQQFFSKASMSEWSEHTISKLGTTYGGLTGKSQEDFGTGAFYIPYLNIFSNLKIDSSHLERVRVQPGEKQNRVQYGDIFFTTSSEVPHEVGMSSVLLDKVDEVYLNSFCFGFRLHSFKVLSPEFARFLFRAPRVRRAISHLAQGATRYNLPKSEFLKLTVSVPTLDKQQKIVRCLSIAETLIGKYEAQLKALEKEKHALVQRLISGKCRVWVENAADPASSVG